MARHQRAMFMKFVADDIHSRILRRIPFYHAEEATKAIIPLLGDVYHSDKQRPFLSGIWESFTKCQWVEPDKSRSPSEEGALWYKGGPSPPPEYSMRVKGPYPLFNMRSLFRKGAYGARNGESSAKDNGSEIESKGATVETRDLHSEHIDG